MKRSSRKTFFMLTILIFAFFATSVLGFSSRYGDFNKTYIKGIRDIRWGTDIQGGVEVTYCPADGMDATSEQMDSAKAVIELRLVSNSITDYELYVDHENDKIIVRFPWKSSETKFDPEEAVKELSATANLTFRPGREYSKTEFDPEGNPIYSVPKGETAETVLVDGSDIESAQAVVTPSNDGTSQSYAVQLKFNETGKNKFADATEKYLNKVISIWMDEEMLSAPQVNSVIKEGIGTITGSFTSAEATSLANKINAGALPFQLDVSSHRSLNPSMGKQALAAMAIAIAVAMCLVCLFMISVYRLPGFVACICLLGHIALSIAAVSGYFSVISSFTLTLPGIAGAILSIGMGADANIIIAERIREELKLNKTLDGAIYVGGKNSFSSIFDGNVTVVIVAIILMLVFGPSNILSKFFGPATTGTIYSFGYMLFIGVLANFVMNIGIARVMLSSLARYKHLRNRKFYGGDVK